MNNKSESQPQTSLMRLYNHQSARLYLNASERGRFLQQVRQQPIAIKSFALTLLYTGCRISEGCALLPIAGLNRLWLRQG